MAENTTTSERRTAPAADWKAIVRKYQEPSSWRASWQLLNTLGPYGLLWALMIFTVQFKYPYWITLALAVVAAGRAALRTGTTSGGSPDTSPAEARTRCGPGYFAPFAFASPSVLWVP